MIMAYFSFTWIELSILIASVLVLFYIWSNHHYGYWKRKGVHGPMASFPSGNMGNVLTGLSQIGVGLSELYAENKNHPFIGLYLLHSKMIMFNDLELIKNVLIRDFQYFPNHGFGISSPKNDPLFYNLFNMEGAEWKAIREKLTPTFTSSKMKYMFNVVLKCSEGLENYLEEQANTKSATNLKEALAKYSTDVIGTCAFGIETNSFKHPDAKFRRMGKKAMETKFFKSIREVLSLFAPSIVKTFQIRVIDKNVQDFFIKTVKETIKYREDNDVTRNDFLQLLIDMKKLDEHSGNRKSLSIIEITAQVLVFFIAGFETSSTTANYALLELARNPHIQKKLRANIDEIIAKHNGQITYESIGEMDYLTQVIEETLRMYPPLPFLFRRCAKDYQIPDTDVIIEKGTLALIPILGIQRDPEIHEAPIEFRPERFSPENKKNMHPMTNMPFGEGPRICIGNRFGMMQTRLGIITIISKYEVSLCSDTSFTTKFNPKSITLSPLDDNSLRITKRN